jgi:serine/threonine-protein kinase
LSRHFVAVQPFPTPIRRHFQVLVLGPFTLRRDGEVIDTSKWQRRVETLFKLLATAPEHRRLRDEIIDIVWPEAAPDAAAGNLRVVVHRLRAALGGGEPSPVISEAGWVMLNPQLGWDVDVDRFNTLVESAHGDVAPLLEAAQLLRGETLAEDRYDDWATPIREHVQRTRRDLCLQLAAIYQARADYDAAARWLERALDDDPFDEDALRALLRVLALAGKRADAVRRYQRFETRLREAIDVSPSDETEALVARIREGGQTGYADDGAGVADFDRLPTGGFLGAAPVTTLVGRQEELERILFTADVVESGTGRLVAISGEAGVGKTRLAQEVSMRLHERGFLVATGRCYQRSRGEFLYPFVDILARLQAGAPAEVRARGLELTQVLHGGRAPDEDLAQLARAITGFFIAVAERQPSENGWPGLAILVDDLQWADAASIDLLQELARRTRGHRILLLVTFRDTEAGREEPLGRALRELSREGLVERVPLTRLSLDATAALVAQTMGGVSQPEEFAEYVYRRTRGNPYFVERMLTALAGRYRLLREVGAGGMGRVFEAIDTRTGKHVAVKLMFARIEADPRALRRFEQEGEALATLRHPNIVQVYDYLVDEYSGCIVMELLQSESDGSSGASLGRILRGPGPAGGGAAQDGRPGPMTLEEARHIAEQVASALAFAHEHGIIHRDVKPDNIMIGPDGVVKVTDFGIARMVRPSASTTLTSKGLTLGTPLYMAPEQIEGNRVDGRADVYSLGAVLYAMVTGRPPFVSDDPITVAYKQVHETPVPAITFNPELPPDWDALIMRALAKDPEDRFPSAAAMRDAIRALSPAAGSALPREGVESADEAFSHPDETDRAGPAWPVASREGVPKQPVSVGTPRSARPTEGGWPYRQPALVLAAALAVIALLAVAVLVAVRALQASHGAAPRPTATTSPISSANSWGSSGTAPGQFEGPTGAGIGAHGTLWVADSANARAQEFSPFGKVIATVGTAGSGPGDFQGPTDVAVAPDGTVYVTDPANRRIEKFSPSPGLRWLADFKVIAPEGGRTFLSSVSTDAAGNLYAADYTGNRIRVFSPSGAVIRSWGQRGSGPGQFNAPDGIAVDQRNRVVYVADKFNYRIEKFGLDGIFLMTWGSRGAAPGRLGQPADVAVGPAGNVYVADPQNNRVQEFSPTGRFLHAWTTDSSGYLPFRHPSGVAVGPSGVIYVTDYYNNRVGRIAASR